MRYGIWEQPKDGSANGRWTRDPGVSGAMWSFDNMQEAQEKANAWNTDKVFKHLHHEVRELPAEWQGLSDHEIGLLLK